MTPLKQRYHHDPENGVYGDCHRAALASLLDLPLDAVPHFMHGLRPGEGELFNQAQEQFLRTRGLTAIIFPIGVDQGLEAVLAALEAYSPGVYYLLGGASSNGTGHTVVAGGGKIVHDPALDNSGIVGPMEDGWYWITYIGSAIGLIDKTRPQVQRHHQMEEECFKCNAPHLCHQADYCECYAVPFHLSKQAEAEYLRREGAD